MGRQPDPGARFPYRRIVPGDCWISDVSSPSYNRLVTAIPCRPNEDLYAIGIGPYRYLATVGYNTNPIVPGLGSAIFLHRHQYTASGASAATSGCISLAEARAAGRAAVARSSRPPTDRHGTGRLARPPLSRPPRRGIWTCSFASVHA